VRSTLLTETVQNIASRLQQNY